MLALQHFLGQPIGPRVGVVRELAELRVDAPACLAAEQVRSEEHTSELQSRFDLVCRLLLEKKKTRICSAGHRHAGPDRSSTVSSPLRHSLPPKRLHQLIVYRPVPAEPITDR